MLYFALLNFAFSSQPCFTKVAITPLIRDRSLLIAQGGRQIGRDNTLKNNDPPYGNTLKKSDPPYGNTPKKSDPPLTPTLHNTFLDNRIYYEGLGDW